MIRLFFEVLLQFSENVFLLSSIVLFYGLVGRLTPIFSPRTGFVLETSVFILAAVLAMSTTQILAPGLGLDSRLVVSALALHSMGPWAAAAVAAAELLYGILSDAQDLLRTAPLMILTPTICFFILRIPSVKNAGRSKRLLILGLAVAFITILAGIPTALELDTATSITLALALIAIHPPATLVMGSFLSLPWNYRNLTSQLESSEKNYRHLFEYAPVALWEEDYSRAARFIRENPELADDANIDQLLQNIGEYFGKIRIIDINQRAVQFAGASSKGELLRRLPETFVPETGRSFLPELRALRDGQTSCTTRSEIQSLEGDRQFVQIHWNVLPGHEQDYARVIVSIIDTTEVIAQANELQESLNNQEMLIKEIHHRVRNSLSIAYSVLGLQKMKLHDKRQRRNLTEMQNRILSISLIHTRLYQTKSILALDLRAYMDDLVQQLSRQEEGKINGFYTNYPSVLLHIDQLLPLGLIVNELIGGSICAAYCTPDMTSFSDPRDERVAASLEIEKTGEEIRVVFAGQFLAVDDAANETSGARVLPEASLRHTMCYSLVEQINGRIAVEFSGKDFLCTIESPLQEVMWTV